jgi:hypothetical protein
MSVAAPTGTGSPLSGRRFTGIGLRELAQVFRKKDKNARVSEPVVSPGSPASDAPGSPLPTVHIAACPSEAVMRIPCADGTLAPPPISSSASRSESPAPVAFTAGPSPNLLIAPASRSPGGSKRRGVGVGEILLEMTYNRYSEQLSINNVALRSLTTVPAELGPSQEL